MHGIAEMSAFLLIWLMIVMLFSEASRHLKSFLQRIAAGRRRRWRRQHRRQQHGPVYPLGEAPPLLTGSVSIGDRAGS